MGPYDKSGPAFPIEDLGYKGMTLRDYFAAQALSGMLADPATDVLPWAALAGDAYKVADAMLAERERKRTP